MVSDTPFFIYLSFSFHITSNLLIFSRLSVKVFSSMTFLAAFKKSKRRNIYYREKKPLPGGERDRKRRRGNAFLASVDSGHPYSWPESSIWMTWVVYMNDPSQPMRKRCFFAFRCRLLLPQVTPLCPPWIYCNIYRWKCCKRWIIVVSLQRYKTLNIN